MKNLKMYYWEKTGYHNGASFAIAESLEEAKELIIKEFKTNYLKDHFNMSLTEQELIKKNEYKNEEEFFIEESYGAYSGLIEELQKEPKVFDVTSKQGFPIWASL
jgi:hypothetical protein